MGAVIGDILGSAVGVAISPVPIIAVILMLFSSQAVSNSLAFLAGWVIGLSAVGAIVLALGLEGSDGEPSTASGWIKIVIGVAFLALGWKQWSGRPAPGEDPEMPSWMNAIDDFTAPKAFGIGVLLSAVNPKNLGLTIAAVVQISGAGLSTGEEIGALAVFVLIASVTIAIPVLANLILGDRATDGLNSMKTWLVANNNVVMTVLFVVLGAKVLGDGISIVA